MKLIIPAGQKVMDFDSKASIACKCVCSSGSSSMDSSAYWNIFNDCSCQCSYGPDNETANDSKADMAAVE